MKKKLEKETKKKSYYRQKQKQSVEIVVRNEVNPIIPTTQELAVPIKEGKDLSIPKTWMSTHQVIFILQTTPKNQKYKRKGKGGQVGRSFSPFSLSALSEESEGSY